MYDATLGRFLGRDPIGYAGGPDLYRYADDSPVNGADPLGLIPSWLQGLIPDQVRDNARGTVRRPGNNAFSEEELGRITQWVIDALDWDDALKFKDVNPNQDPLMLTKQQKQIIDTIIKNLPQGELGDKVRREYAKVLKDGKVKVEGEAACPAPAQGAPSAPAAPTAPPPAAASPKGEAKGPGSGLGPKGEAKPRVDWHRMVIYNGPHVTVAWFKYVNGVVVETQVFEQADKGWKRVR
jgi:hypothetical protein